MTETTEPQTSANALNSDANASPAEHHDVATDQPIKQAASEVEDLDGEDQSGEVKLTILGSAEIATRAANLAGKAGMKLQQETQNLIASYKIQQRHGMIMLISFGSLVLIACILFGWISIRMQSRVVQLDAMLLAVGKRVVAMDDSLQALAATSDTLRDMSAKQDAISNQQARTDVRMEDLLKALGDSATGKASDPKSADILKLLQGMDARVQAQTNHVKALTSQASSASRPALDAGVVRREVEAALRQQRQAQEAAAKTTATSTAASAMLPAAPAPVAKPRERLVQYPRAQAQGSTAETQ